MLSQGPIKKKEFDDKTEKKQHFEIENWDALQCWSDQDTQLMWQYSASTFDSTLKKRKVNIPIRL